MDGAKAMGDTKLFLVRVWWHLSQFHASVRALDEGEPRLFTQAQQVGEFLSQSVAARDETAAPATGTTTPEELRP